MRTDDIRQTDRPAGMVPPVGRSEAEYAPLLIVFVFSNNNGIRRVRCRGCREILPPARPVPEHIRGTVELDGQRVPMIDAGIWVYAEQTPIDSCTCILIADRPWKSKRLLGGVLIPDIEEVMQLAAGNFDSRGRADASVNLRLVLDADGDEGFTALLVESYRDLGLLGGLWERVPEGLYLDEASCEHLA
jgi:hypothetical protein